MKPSDHFDLDAQLRALHAPERSEEYWADFPRRVTGELRTRPLPRPMRTTWLPQLAWGFSLAFGCFALGYFIGHNDGSRGFTHSLLQNQQEFRMSLAKFPEQFRTLMLDERGMQKLLPDQP
jgi:hypothetical protein